MYVCWYLSAAKRGPAGAMYLSDLAQEICEPYGAVNSITNISTIRLVDLKPCRSHIVQLTCTPVVEGFC
jgi:hypothetical protein